MLELGALLLVIGLVGTIISFWYNWFLDPAAPGMMGRYRDLVDRPGEGDYNLIILIVAPIILIWGGFWVGEQLVLRRRFERLLDTPKRSEFASRRTDLEAISKRLPDGYRTRIKEKESEFVTKRA